jgi:hypothetical protein
MTRPFSTTFLLVSFILAVFCQGVQSQSLLCRGNKSYELRSSLATPAYTSASGLDVASTFALLPNNGDMGLGVAFWVSMHAIHLPATPRVVLL